VAKRIPLPAKLAGVALLGVTLLLPGCGTNHDPWKDVPGGKPRVLTSFTPLYCFAKAVAGPDVAVLSLLTTLGPHDHNTTAPDVLAARKADLFLVNGLALDDFATEVANSAGNSRSDLIQKLGEAIPTSQLIRIADVEHNHPPGEKCDCCHGEFDPHVWLGVPEAILMVNRIADLLAERDPAHKDGYRARAAAYVKRLNKLLDEGRAAFKGKQNRKFITNHHSFRYFARSFGLEVLDSIQMQPGIEPDGAQLARLEQICKDNDVRVIGVEPQYNPGAAEVLRDRLRKALPNLAIIELDPIETAPTPEFGPDYYLERMKANIDNLAKHLR
jgi:zinc transport system substrate-binding protein